MIQHTIAATSEKINAYNKNLIQAARDNVAVYAQCVTLKRSNAWLIGSCPFHDDQRPSFAVKDGRWTCFAGCGSGDTIDFIQRLRRIDFAAAVQVLADGVPVAYRSGVSRETRSERKLPSENTYVTSLWESAQEPRLAEVYLWSRGLHLRSLPDALRGHRSVYCSEAGENRPAVLATIRSGPDGLLTAVQRVWCEHRLPDAKGIRCADLEASKKTIGEMGDGAIRLYESGPTLGLAEGFETAIACYRLFRVPVWASAGAWRMGSVAIPDHVHDLIIFADQGDEGRRAAHKAAGAHGRNRRVEIAYPKPRYSDFLDQLNG